MMEYTPEYLAKAVKAWRGDLTCRTAAQMIGIPVRTLEGIEQGRGFRYPKLLIITIGSLLERGI